MKKKLFYERPSSKLLEITEQIKGFQTPRLAKELWNAEEDILKKEGLWPNFFNLKYDSLMEFYAEHTLYQIDYTKKNFADERMIFSYIGKGKLCICLIRNRFIPDFNIEDSEFVFLKKCFQKNIFSIMIIDNDRDIYKEFIEDYDFTI